jgi:hypothetical protein
MSTMVFVGLCLLLPRTTPTHGEELNQNLLRDARYHRAQATMHSQEAGRLDQALRRYEIMQRIYQNGSDRSSGTANPQGRRLMVERTKRVIYYFTQKKQETERRAAEHEALAQALPDR